MKTQEVDNAEVPIARPQVGGMDKGTTTIVHVLQCPHFQKAVFSLIYMVTETRAL